jgi:hypothetical protein
MRKAGILLCFVERRTWGRMMKMVTLMPTMMKLLEEVLPHLPLALVTAHLELVNALLFVSVHIATLATARVRSGSEVFVFFF